MANQYMDVHKEEVAKSLFRTESMNEDHSGDKATWNNVRYGMKNEPRSKSHGNQQLKHDDTDSDEAVEPAKEFIPYRFAIGNPKLLRKEETSPLSESKKTKTIKIKNLDAVDEILQGYDHDVDGNEVTMTVKDMSEFMKEVKDAGIKI